MTEEDTFNKLRKATFSSILAMLDAIPNDAWEIMSDEDKDELFTSRGWTYHEYAVTNTLYHKGLL